MYNNTVPKTLKEQEIFFACRRFEDGVRTYGVEEIVSALDTEIVLELVSYLGWVYDLGDEGSGRGVSGH